MIFFGIFLNYMSNWYFILKENHYLCNFLRIFKWLKIQITEIWNFSSQNLLLLFRYYPEISWNDAPYTSLALIHCTYRPMALWIIFLHKIFSTLLLNRLKHLCKSAQINATNKCQLTTEKYLRTHISQSKKKSHFI